MSSDPAAACRARTNIQNMRGYTPGEQPRVGKIIKLNTNENPYPPSDKVIRAIQQAAVGGLQRYPDPLSTSFRLAAAELWDVDPSWVLTGNGSDDLLTILTRTFVSEGERLRLPYPSYILYRTLADIQAAEFEEVMFQPDWTLDRRVRRAASRFATRLFAQPQQPQRNLRRANSRSVNGPSHFRARSSSMRPMPTLPKTRVLTSYVSCPM